MKAIHYLIALFIAMSAISCKQSAQQPSKNVNIKSTEFQNKLIEANKMYVKQESDEIDQYVKRKNWNMTVTGTGLRYMITSSGGGAPVKTDQIVKVNYKIILLDGRVCYSSDSLGPKEFVVGADNVETGLHEGIQYLHVGDRATLILPSHLAHGLIGDESKIPPKASVIYELELLSVKDRVKK
ncbi:MAG TPA: FKBP-type peptidyl-prolyl cis-trans isomerase [Bacteroidia bacterium]|jgi:FKBP-type peptidyl-prolyl cis-trans isomerase|nr:FKBP-type peptidyl-prolyl cis-trans isomerase [Bacteroidia bacterium]HRG53377.1 FKBP-type peptidyl-prolyl cis-trans isomerase [Bacteroidia bacterium]